LRLAPSLGCRRSRRSVLRSTAARDRGLGRLRPRTESGTASALGPCAQGAAAMAAASPNGGGRREPPFCGARSVVATQERLPLACDVMGMRSALFRSYVACGVGLGVTYGLLDGHGLDQAIVYDVVSVSSLAAVVVGRRRSAGVAGSRGCCSQSGSGARLSATSVFSSTTGSG
jgi:hypothetical protein